MQRTNIHLTNQQRAGLDRLGKANGTGMAIEVRRAIDAHLTFMRAALKSGSKLPTKKTKSK